MGDTVGIIALWLCAAWLVWVGISLQVIADELLKMNERDK